MPRVKVFLRVRPSSTLDQHAASGACLDVDAAAQTATITQRARGLSSSSSSSQQHVFRFESVLPPHASQGEVFELCGADLVARALDGINACVLAYGQTGAGKTHTMSGAARHSYEQRGLVPRLLGALLAALRDAPGLAAWSLCLSYLEVFNDGLYDLLDLTADPAELRIHEDGAGCLQVAGLRQVPVTSEAQALSLFFEGEANRVIAAHRLNRESSRSHSVLMLTTACEREGGGAGAVTSSKIFLVDLAGSERVAKTGSEGVLLREACAINRSLALLEQVVLAATAAGVDSGGGGRGHVPFRSCKLTHVLRDCLGGGPCDTRLIACVWADAAQADESLSTCRFAARMAALEVEIRRNTLDAAGQGARVRALEREVQQLREQLALVGLQQQLAVAAPQQQEAGGAADAPHSAAERAQLRQTVMAWLLEEQRGVQLPLANVRQLHELLHAFKAIVQDALRGQLAPSSSACMQQGPPHSAPSWQQQRQQPQHPHQPQPAAGSSLGATNSSSSSSWQWPPDSQQALVGDGGNAAGAAAAAAAAPADARPASYGSLSTASDGWPGAEPHRSSTASSAGAVDASTSLAAFRAGPGAEAARLLNDNHARLKAAKRRRAELAASLNALKARLGEAQAQQAALKAQRLAAVEAAAGDEGEAPATAQVLSPAEFELLTAIRDLKAKFRDAHAELALVCDEVAYISGLLEVSKAELAAGFEEWLAAQAQGSVEQAHGAAPSRPDSSASGSLALHQPRPSGSAGSSSSSGSGAPLSSASDVLSEGSGAVGEAAYAAAARVAAAAGRSRVTAAVAAKRQPSERSTFGLQHRGAGALQPP